MGVTATTEVKQILPTSTGVEGGASGPDQELPLKGLSVMTAASIASTKAKTEKQTGASVGLPNSDQGAHRARPEGDDRDRRASEGWRYQGVQQQDRMI